MRPTLLYTTALIILHPCCFGFLKNVNIFIILCVIIIALAPFHSAQQPTQCDHISSNTTHILNSQPTVVKEVLIWFWVYLKATAFAEKIPISLKKRRKSTWKVGRDMTNNSIITHESNNMSCSLLDFIMSFSVSPTTEVHTLYTHDAPSLH